MTKKTIAIIGGIVLAILSAIVVYSGHEHKLYLEAKGASAVLTADFVSYQTNAKTIIASLTAEAAQLLTAKNAAIDKANAAELSKDKIAADLAALQAQTALLPPNALAANINTRLGANQTLPIAAGGFSLTRPGAESALNLFLAGEADASRYKAEQTVSLNLRVALDASERESGNLGQRLSLTTGELDRAVKAWDADKDALTHLEHSILGTRIKAFAWGAGTGAVTVAILHILKVI